MSMAPSSPAAGERPLPSWTANDGVDTQSEALKALQVYKQKDTEKVVVLFKAVGNAPIMKQNLFKITGSNRFQAVIQFLRHQMSWKQGEPLFTYVNLAFSPAPDDPIINLYRAFATDGHLIVNYSTTAAWG